MALQLVRNFFGQSSPPRSGAYEPVIESESFGNQEGIAHYDTRDVEKTAETSNWFELARHDKETNEKKGRAPNNGSRNPHTITKEKRKQNIWANNTAILCNLTWQWLLVLRLKTAVGLLFGVVPVISWLKANEHAHDTFDLPDAVPFPRMLCMAHTLQLTIKKAYIHHDGLLIKVRRLVALVRKSSVAVTWNACVSEIESESVVCYWICCMSKLSDLLLLLLVWLCLTAAFEQCTLLKTMFDF